MKINLCKSLAYLGVLSVTVVIHAADQALSGPIQIVVPNKYAGTDPGGVVNAMATELRCQQVLLASEFWELPPDYREIIQIAVRPAPSLNQPWTVTADNMLIRFSTTDASPQNLDPTFADNIGADETTVFDGPLTLHTDNIQTQGGLKEFDYIFSLKELFEYDPNHGNLLIDWTYYGASGPTYVDFIMDHEPETRLIAGSPGSSQASPDNVFGGHVWQLTFVPEPSSFLLAVTGAAAFLAATCWRRRKRAA
ncbi:MAG: PEP-CTERM sorting domain-containing protein [Planctomycetota bacterium]|jgi:hypothetical protein